MARALRDKTLPTRVRDRRDVSYPLLLSRYREESDYQRYIPASGEAGPDEIPAALKEAVREDPGLQERPPEDVSRDLARGGYLEEAPSPTLVAEVLQALEHGEG